MKYRIAILVVCFELILSVPVFAQAKLNVPPPAQPPAPAVIALTLEDPHPVLGVPAGYRYEAHGRRDPFVNPIPKPSPAAIAAAAIDIKPERPPGLRGASVDDVAPLGILVSRNDPSMTRVILRVTGIKAPVMASRGDVLFDAVIKEIRQDSVVFTRVPPANIPRNPLEPREIVKQVRSTAGDKK